VSGATGGAGGSGGAAYAPTQAGQAGQTAGDQQAAQPHQPPQAYQPPSPGPAPSGGFGPAQQQEPYQQGVPDPGAQGQGLRRPRPAARPAPRTRKARLRVAKADPWSVMKVSFLLSIALGVCTIVAVAVLWMVLDAIGVFATVGDTISDATGSGTDGGFDLQGFLSLPRVLMFTSIIAVIDVVLATALATLGAFIYNLSAGFVGGVELTLAEDE
jgi:hypothetical protein